MLPFIKNSLKAFWATLLHKNQGKALSLRHNFAWNLAGNVVYAGCQWGMIVVLAKATSPEVVGQFALGLAVTAPIFLFSQLQLRGIQATDAKDEYTFGHYLGLRIITTLLAMVITIGIALFSYDKHTAAIILAVALSKLFESISDVFYGLMQKHERMDRIAISRMAKGPLSLIALGLGALLTHELLWGVLAMAAVWGGILLAFDIPNGRRVVRENGLRNAVQTITPNFDLKRILHLAWLAIPLGVVIALLSLNTNLPRYFIENYLGKDQLGVFAALAYLITFGGLVINAMGQSVTPRLAKYYANGGIVLFKKLMLRMLVIGGFIGFTGIGIAMLAGEEILRIIYGHEYAARQNVFVLIMAAGAMNYFASFCGYGVTAVRAFRIQFPLGIVITITTALLAPYLIRSHGLIGAASVLFFSATLTTTLYATVLAYALNKRKKE